MRARPNSRYARRNPFGAARYDAGGQVQSNVGAGGAGPMPHPQGWTGTSQPSGGWGGGGKGMGYGMPFNYGMQQAQNPTNYGPSFQSQFNVPWGYFNNMQYNPLLYAGFMGMMPRPWQYSGPSLPMFQSQHTFNPAPPPAPPPQPQQPSGDGGFRVLPNFNENGQIISIPQGVSWSPQENTWVNSAGATSWQSPPPGFGDPNAGTPLSQYTGPAPWNPTGQQPQQQQPQGGGGYRSIAGGTGQAPTGNPWEGLGGAFHARRGGPIRRR